MDRKRRPAHHVTRVSAWAISEEEDGGRIAPGGFAVSLAWR
jgi:hypothetical protein